MLQVMQIEFCRNTGTIIENVGNEVLPYATATWTFAKDTPPPVTPRGGYS